MFQVALTRCRYFADHLEDIDPSQATVLFRVVAGDSECVVLMGADVVVCARVRVTRVSAVKKWSGVAGCDGCVTFDEFESVCVLDNRSNSVRACLQPNRISLIFPSGLVVRPLDQRPIQIRVVSPSHGRCAVRGAGAVACHAGPS